MKYIFFLKVPKFSGHGVKALVVDCVTSSTGSPDNLGTYYNALFKNSFGDFLKCSKVIKKLGRCNYLTFVS